MSLYPMYARPRNVEQAVELLSGLTSGAVIIAGGQELLPSVNYGVLMPEVYIDIGGIEELRGIGMDDGRVSIGALTVHRDIQCDPLVLENLPLLAHSAAQIGGGWQVHNRGTIGGNIVSMHPLYDIAPALLALDAEVEIACEGGSRSTSFAGLLKETSHGLGSDALLTRIRVKPQDAGTCWGYQKLKSSGGAYGSANAAALVGLKGGAISLLRLVVGAAAERLTLVEEQLQPLLGQVWSAELGKAVESACREAIDMPLSDQQGDAEWRRAMAGVVARRAVEQAIAAADERTN